MLLILTALLSSTLCSLFNIFHDDRYTKHGQINLAAIEEVPVSKIDFPPCLDSLFLGRKPGQSLGDLSVPLRPFFTDGDNFLEHVAGDLNSRYPDEKFTANHDKFVTKGHVEALLYRHQYEPIWNFLDYEVSYWSRSLAVNFAMPPLTPGEVKCAELEVAETSKRADALAKYLPRLEAMAKDLGFEMPKLASKQFELDELSFFQHVDHETFTHNRLVEVYETFLHRLAIKLCELDDIGDAELAKEVKEAYDRPLINLLQP